MREYRCAWPFCRWVLLGRSCWSKGIVCKLPEGRSQTVSFSWAGAPPPGCRQAGASTWRTVTI
eukprot:3277898-Pyramimonas_sp.AAC.1